METWLVTIEGKHNIMYSAEKPVVADQVIGKLGDIVLYCDPDYALTDLTYPAVIINFEIVDKIVYYELENIDKTTKKVHEKYIFKLSGISQWYYKKFVFKSS